MWEIAIPAVAGLISGAMGSLFAPWANWGVEKKRLQQTARAKLLDEVRAVLLSPPPSEEFRQLPIYSRIRPYLSDDAKKAVDGTFHGLGEEGVIIVTGGRHAGVNPYAQRVLDELTCLEKKWALI
jgi:hypothetical protein